MPRKPEIRLLVTDLDNTLYDWVSFFTPSIYEMVRIASKILGVSEERLIADLKRVHERAHDTERPFALLETDVADEAYPDLSHDERAVQLDEALHAFNRGRKRRLQLYPGVRQTLARLAGSGTIIVAHTDAHAINAAFRLKSLGIDDTFDRIYAPAGDERRMPARIRRRSLADVLAKVCALPVNARKPSPQVIRRICRDFGVAPEHTLFVGDSLVRDVGMAKAVGAHAAWARYGTRFDNTLLTQLQRVTHWTAAEIDGEKHGSTKASAGDPDATLESFEELLGAFAFGARWAEPELLNRWTPLPSTATTRS